MLGGSRGERGTRNGRPRRFDEPNIDPNPFMSERSADAEGFVPAGGLVPPPEHPAETLRLISRQRDALAAEGFSWADWAADEQRKRLLDGSWGGALWIGPGDEAIGLASWESIPDLGRRGSIWGSIFLGDGYRNGAVLRGFLDRLEQWPPGAGPLLSCSDDIPGLPLQLRKAVFGSRGFFRVIRRDLVFPLARPLPAPATPTARLRSLSPADEPALAGLLERAYADDAIERSLFEQFRNPTEDARYGVDSVLHGHVGRWLDAASFGIEADGRLIAATLANEFHGPLITEVLVDPEHRRKGLARRLLVATLLELRSLGFAAPRLVVTGRNQRAVNLYLGLGFEPSADPAGGLWLNLPALGIAPPPGEGSGA